MRVVDFLFPNQGRPGDNVRWLKTGLRKRSASVRRLENPRQRKLAF
jgi:hypothetical protein